MQTLHRLNHFDSRTMHWYGPDKHYWFRADVAVPQEMDGKPLWMHVCTQIDEWDDAKTRSSCCLWTAR